MKVTLGLLQHACSASPEANLKKTLALADQAAEDIGNGDDDRVNVAGADAGLKLGVVHKGLVLITWTGSSGSDQGAT